MHPKIQASKTDPSIVGSVELPRAGEQDGPGGHIEAHRKGLGREESLNEALAEQDFSRLLQNGQQTWEIFKDILNQGLPKVNKKG